MGERALESSADVRRDGNVSAKFVVRLKFRYAQFTQVVEGPLPTSRRKGHIETVTRMLA